MNRDEFLQKLEQHQEEDIEIVKAKNQDYAEGSDPFQNFRMVEDAGLVSVEKGIAVRMSDKMQRIFNLLDEEAAVDDETIADTLSDLRNYANILQTYLEKERHSTPACQHECLYHRDMDEWCDIDIEGSCYCSLEEGHDGPHVACDKAEDRHALKVKEQ